MYPRIQAIGLYGSVPAHTHSGVSPTSGEARIQAVDANTRVPLETVDWDEVDGVWAWAQTWADEGWGDVWDMSVL